MNFWTSLLHNFPLVCAGTGWFVAQIIKVFTGVFKLRKFSITGLLFGNGGMPSSHSASVTALAIACGLTYGFDSGYFAIAMLFAIIVTCMPCGLNTIVFPKLVGEDCSLGAGLVLTTHALSCITLPFWLFLIT